MEQEDEETGEKKQVPFLRYYNVFHIDQCKGVTPKYTTEITFLMELTRWRAAAQDIIYDYLSREGVKLLHEEGDRAFYRPSTDEVAPPSASSS